MSDRFIHLRSSLNISKEPSPNVFLLHRFEIHFIFPSSNFNGAILILDEGFLEGFLILCVIFHRTLLRFTKPLGILDIAG